MATSLFVRINAAVEFFVISRLVPDRVGKFMRLVFKVPVWLYQLGLGVLVSRRFLILTTIGRKTGKPRMTALEYTYYPTRDEYLLMSGWGGRSDWYRNAQANPQVQFRIRNKRVKAIVRPANDEDVVKVFEEILAINPKAVRAWASYSGVQYDGTRNSLVQMAPAFPSFIAHAET